jgi:ATP-binding cassette subfamily C protein LapB
MLQASKISGTDEFVKKHPKGYEMPVGERGAGLSGGQRQSIGVARAFLLDAPILLMDEPTNAMDQVTETNLLNNLEKALQGKTAIIVTQKMTLLKIVDRVIVMNEGRIAIDDTKEQAILKLQGGGKKNEA